MLAQRQGSQLTRAQTAYAIINISEFRNSRSGSNFVDLACRLALQTMSNRDFEIGGNDYRWSVQGSRQCSGTSLAHVWIRERARSALITIMTHDMISTDLASCRDHTMISTTPYHWFRYQLVDLTFSLNLSQNLFWMSWRRCTAMLRVVQIVFDYACRCMLLSTGLARVCGFLQILLNFPDTARAEEADTSIK